MPSQKIHLSRTLVLRARAFAALVWARWNWPCVLQPSAFVQTSHPLFSSLLPPLLFTFDSTFLHLFFFLTFYCSNIICFCKLHILRMHAKLCPCPLVGIVATFVALFAACFGCRVRANFDWDILLWALLLPPQTHTRALCSSWNRSSKQIAHYIYYALAFRAIGIMFATNMQFFYGLFTRFSSRFPFLRLPFCFSAYRLLELYRNRLSIAALCFR